MRFIFFTLALLYSAQLAHATRPGQPTERLQIIECEFLLSDKSSLLKAQAKFRRAIVESPLLLSHSADEGEAGYRHLRLLGIDPGFTDLQLALRNEASGYAGEIFDPSGRTVFLKFHLTPLPDFFHVELHGNSPEEFDKKMREHGIVYAELPSSAETADYYGIYLREHEGYFLAVDTNLGEVSLSARVPCNSVPAHQRRPVRTRDGWSCAVKILAFLPDRTSKPTEVPTH